MSMLPIAPATIPIKGDTLIFAEDRPESIGHVEIENFIPTAYNFGGGLKGKFYFHEGIGEFVGINVQEANFATNVTRYEAEAAVSGLLQGALESEGSCVNLILENNKHFMSTSYMVGAIPSIIEQIRQAGKDVQVFIPNYGQAYRVNTFAVQRASQNAGAGVNLFLTREHLADIVRAQYGIIGSH